MVYKFDYIFDYRIWWVLEVLWSLIIRVYHPVNCAIEQRLYPRRVFHEVENKHVIKVAVNLVHVLEVDSVVQLGKFENDFYHFRLVVAAQTAMGSATEDSFTALEDKVWADWILCSVKCLVEWLLLR